MTGRFRTKDGTVLPEVSAEEMWEIDRIAVEEVGLKLLQMMEHAGRNIALEALELVDTDPILVLAGGGGNGGGGLCCARHLANRGREVVVVLDRPRDDLEGAVRTQYRILTETDAEIGREYAEFEDARLLIDALIGYGLSDAPRGRAAALIEASEKSERILSLDVPSGVNATTGERPGRSVSPSRTLTLALPKRGLADVEGEITLADIGIPEGVYRRAGIEYDAPFDRGFRIPVISSP